MINKFLLSVCIVIFFAPVISFAGLVGLWNFNSSLTNSVAGGTALSIDGGPTTSYINETINGHTARVLQFPAFSSYSQRISMPNDAANPARTYTLVFDIKFPVRSGWTALLDFDHSGDSDFFIADNGGIGISGGYGSYQGSLLQDTWYRIAIVCQYDGKIRITRMIKIQKCCPTTTNREFYIEN